MCWMLSKSVSVKTASLYVLSEGPWKAPVLGATSELVPCER